MTKQQSIEYALACKRAKKNGEPKPPRPDNATSASTLLDVHKTIISARTSLELLTEQMQSVVDYLFNMKDKSPAAEAYAQTLDFIWGQMMEIEIKLKKVR